MLFTIHPRMRQMLHQRYVQLKAKDGELNANLWFRGMFGPTAYRQVVKGLPPGKLPQGKSALQKLDPQASANGSEADLPNRDAEVFDFAEARRNAQAKLLKPEGTEDCSK